MLLEHGGHIRRLLSFLVCATPVLVAGQTGREIAVPAAGLRILDSEWEWTWEVETRITLDPLDGTEPLVYNPGAILPLEEGRLLVADQDGDFRLLLISTSGELLNRMGREGSGPLEIRSVAALLRRPSGEVLVVDGGNGKILTLSVEGRLTTEVRSRATGITRGWVHVGPDVPPLVEQWYGAETGQFSLRVASLDLDSGERRDVAELPLWVRAGRPQFGRPLWTAVPNGLVIGRSDRGRFGVHGLDGTLLHTLVLPLTARRLSQSDIQRQVRVHGNIARSLEPGPIAITNALFPWGEDAFAMFQSGLWRAAEDPSVEDGEIIWRIISLDGQPRGWFRPDGFRPLHWDGLRAWGVALDEFGVPRLERRRFVPPPGA